MHVLSWVERSVEYRLDNEKVSVVLALPWLPNREKRVAKISFCGLTLGGLFDDWGYFCHTSSPRQMAPLHGHVCSTLLKAQSIIGTSFANWWALVLFVILFHTLRGGHSRKPFTPNKKMFILLHYCTSSVCRVSQCFLG
jgi:hypothetical protein